VKEERAILCVVCTIENVSGHEVLQVEGGAMHTAELRLRDPESQLYQWKDERECDGQCTCEYCIRVSANDSYDDMHVLHLQNTPVSMH
jgi:hypothetical protein